MAQDKEPLWRRLFRRREPSAFVAGDATGAVFRNVDTSAGEFVRGDQSGSVSENIRHERPER